MLTGELGRRCGVQRALRAVRVFLRQARAALLAGLRRRALRLAIRLCVSGFGFCTLRSGFRVLRRLAALTLRLHNAHTYVFRSIESPFGGFFVRRSTSGTTIACRATRASRPSSRDPRRRAAGGARRLRRPGKRSMRSTTCAFPPPPSRTKWTRLVHPSVLTGHVSSTC
jgi:hypothetical protein